jgi:hypothetical protein
MKEEELNKAYAKEIKREKIIISFISITIMTFTFALLIIVLNFIAKIG